MDLPSTKRPYSEESGADEEPKRLKASYSKLCNFCSKVAIPKLQEVFRSPQTLTAPKAVRVELGTVFHVIDSEEDCNLCKFFVETLSLRVPDASYKVYDGHKYDKLALRSTTKPWFTEAGIHLDLKSCPFAWLSIGHESEEPFICISLEPKTQGGSGIHPLPGCICPIKRDPLEAFNGNCHEDIVLAWLERCKRQHVRCTDTQMTLPPGFLVIDVHSRKLTWLPPNHPFLTLSYVWGRGSYQQRYWQDNSQGLIQHCQQHGEGLTLPGSLPQTIEDAIIVTQKLKQRYIWVDLFCIDQTDDVGKQEQIEAMDAIFASSWLTLVCVDGVDSDYGLTGTSRHMSQTKQPKVVTPIGRLTATYIHSQWCHNGDSAHDQRGWTLQERLLSRRCLSFADTYFSMLCQEELFHELIDIHNIPSDTNMQLGSEYFREDGSDLDLNNPEWSFDTYGNLISVYTKRDITDQDDAYNACRGSLTRITAKCGMEFHFGLPKDDMLQALLWVPHFENSLCRRRGFPSWSWLGWKGRAEYPYWLHHRNTTNRPCEPRKNEENSMSRNKCQFEVSNGILEAIVFTDKTMTAPVMQLKTTVRSYKVELICQSDSNFRPSPTQGLQRAIGDQWAILKQDNSKLKNRIGEKQYFEPTHVSFRLHRDQSKQIDIKCQQVDLIFIKYWDYIWDEKRNEKHLVSALVTVKDKEGSYQRLACVIIAADEWLGGESRNEIVTLV